MFFFFTIALVPRSTHARSEPDQPTLNPTPTIAGFHRLATHDQIS